MSEHNIITHASVIIVFYNIIIILPRHGVILLSLTNSVQENLKNQQNNYYKNDFPRYRNRQPYSRQNKNSLFEAAARV